MKASPCKVYVSVQVDFDEDGSMCPRFLRWEDGRAYAIDRVLDVRPAPSLRGGGHGDRYTVRIGGQTACLFFEHAADGGSAAPGRWFVERGGGREDRS